MNVPTRPTATLRPPTPDAAPTAAEAAAAARTLLRWAGAAPEGRRAACRR